MNDKYLILAVERSGSCLVRSFCHNPPQNNCLFEPFRFRPEQFKKMHINASLPVICNRQENPVNYLNYFFNLNNKNFNGAKVIISSLSTDLLAKILNSKEFKIILLYRENLLETFVSRRIAGITHQWGVNRGFEHKKVKLKKPLILDKEDAEEYMTRLFKKVKFCKEILKSYKKERFLETTYETVFSPAYKLNMQEVNRIRNFVGASLINNFTPKMVKQNNNDAYKLIKNRQNLELGLGKKFGYLGKRSEPSIWD